VEEAPLGPSCAHWTIDQSIDPRTDLHIQVPPHRMPPPPR
jgi:hypothetical protein